MLLWTEAVLLGPITHCSCWTHTTTSFFQNQSLLQRTTTVRLENIPQKYTMGSEDNLIKRIPENVWGNSYINGSIKGLHLSQGHYFEESKIHLYCKSDFLKSQQQRPMSLLSCLSMSPNMSQHHTAEANAGASMINNTTSSQKSRAIQHRAHAVVVNYCRSSQHPEGDLLRHFATENGKVVNKH